MIDTAAAEGGDGKVVLVGIAQEMASVWRSWPAAPWPIWVYLNGYEWAKQQLGKAGIGFEALDNSFPVL